MKQSEARTLAEQLSGAFFVFGAIVASAAVVTAVMYAVSTAWLTPEFEHSELAERNEVAAFSTMVGQEDELRGYLLTRDPNALIAYNVGATALERINHRLAGDLGALPAAELTIGMVRTRLAQERWQGGWAQPVVRWLPGTPPPSMQVGKALFDVYRRERAALAASLVRHRERLEKREHMVITVRLAFELTVFVAVLLLAVRQHRALRTAIVDPVAALLRHIRRIRDGQLEATADPLGPRELEELAQGLNQMVSALSNARGVATSRDVVLREHSVRLRQILDASREFSESLNLTYVVGAVRASTAAVGGYAEVIVWLMDDVEKRLTVSGAPAHDTPSDASALAHPLAVRAAKSGRITFEGSTGVVRFNDSSACPARAIAIPLIVGARAVGVLEARHATPQVATGEALEVLEMLATHAATAIESARLHEIVEERSHVDGLTKLLNRRRLDQDLEAECKRSARYARPLSLVMLDVDHFKSFNDAHGHPAADRALQQVADVIAGCVRATDTAYRYGGEEFCVVLRETSAPEAMRFAERVRQRIEQKFLSGETSAITASFGVADCGMSHPNPRTLIEAADAAMYESKNAGRNRVMLSSRPPDATGTSDGKLEGD